MLRWLKSLTNLILKLVYPNHCPVCNGMTDEELLCLECSHKLEETNYGNWVKDIHYQAGIDRAFSCWFFNQTLQKLIHQVKYSDRPRTGTSLGEMAARLLGPEVVRGVDYLTAVPLHSIKKRERGYNQALWIGRGMAEEWGLPFEEKLLQRRKHTESQTTLSREERLHNMENAFVISRSVYGKKIGIIDDVLTTGATISACAVTLKAAGAEGITVITCGTPNPQDKT